VDISNATERRHSPEIAANAQKHKQRNLEKPATDVQDKPATNGQIKEDSVEISEEGRAAASRQYIECRDKDGNIVESRIWRLEPGPQEDNLFAQFNEMRRAQIEERKQFLSSEAEAFMDKINKYIKNSELRDQGYVTWMAEWEPVKPNPPDKLERGFMEKGYDYFDRSSFHERLKEFDEEYEAYHKKYGNIPFKFQKEAFSWEEMKEMECDQRYSMYSEKNKAWYANFLQKANSVQNIINNAKLITDFSGNEKWNIVMNLLP